jgi:leucyl aminopeptidase
VNLTYKGNPATEDVHAMIGKGIIFDTGGYNIKPTGFMEDMYVDKGGASAVFGAFTGIV